MFRNAVVHFFLPTKPDIDNIEKKNGTPEDFTIEEDALSAITQRYTELKQILH
jgi:hypothetical protein